MVFAGDKVTRRQADGPPLAGAGTYPILTGSRSPRRPGREHPASQPEPSRPTEEEHIGLVTKPASRRVEDHVCTGRKPPMWGTSRGTPWLAKPGL